MKIKFFILATLIISESSLANISEWVFRPMIPEFQVFFKKPLLGFVENLEMGTTQVVIGKLQRPEIIPHSQPAWKEFALATLDKGFDYSIAALPITKSIRPTYSAEISWSTRDHLAMKSRILFIVTDRSVLAISYSEDTSSYTNDIKKFSGLFESIAQGKEEDIVRQALKTARLSSTAAK
jgi:hypothetical protein